MKTLAILLTLTLSACVDVPMYKPCPEAPLMRPDQTTRSYTLQLLDLYNECRDNHAATR